MEATAESITSIEDDIDKMQQSIMDMVAKVQQVIQSVPGEEVAKAIKGTAQRVR